MNLKLFYINVVDKTKIIDSNSTITQKNENKQENTDLNQINKNIEMNNANKNSIIEEYIYNKEINIIFNSINDGIGNKNLCLIIPQDIFNNRYKTISDNTNNKQYLGKKRKKEEKIYNFQSYNDNIIKKIRIMILNSIIKFINIIITIIFNNKIGKGLCSLQFFPIDEKYLSHSKVVYDKEFLNYKLKDILSLDVSGKYSGYLKHKNAELVQILINLEKNSIYFRALFNLTFFDCLEHIRGTKNNNLLNGLFKIDQMLENEGKNLNKDDIECYKETIKKYEKLINDKKPIKNYKAKK